MGTGRPVRFVPIGACFSVCSSGVSKTDRSRLATVNDMSVEVSIEELFQQVGEWGFCYLLTVSDDERPHLLALNPLVDQRGDTTVLRFDAGGGRACRNAAARPHVSLVFPPRDGGMSLVVDGVAVVDGSTVDVTPTWAVLHRAAP